MNVWTLESWQVQAGREDEFIAAWTQLIDWTREQAPGIASSAVPLYRDAAEPSRFFCPIAWESQQAIDGWQAAAGYRQRAEPLRRLCSEVTFRVLVTAARVAIAPDGQ